MKQGVRLELFGPMEEKFILVLAWIKETAYGYQIIAIRHKEGNQNILTFSYWQKNLSTVPKMLHIEEWRQLPWQPVSMYRFKVHVRVPQETGLTFWSLDVS